MMDTLEHFEQQVQKGLAQELRGWDFTWLHAHTRSSQLPWDYRQIVLEHMKEVHSLLDTGTGGGEFLASLAPLPPDTHAAEGYAPNVPAARRRLEPLGVKIADVTGDDEHLPYPDRSFDLVIDRHNGCEPAEVYRVLRPGGLYITQQVGGENCMDLNRFLQEQPVYPYAHVQLDAHVRQLQEAGFTILRAEEAFPEWTFLDTAGVVYNLKVVPWQIEDFSVEKYRDALYRLHQQIEKDGGFTVREHRYLIVAEKTG
jgi:SAM-dependent methyltransferase